MARLLSGAKPLSTMLGLDDGSTGVDLQNVIVLSLSVLGVVVAIGMCCIFCVCPWAVGGSPRGRTKRRSKKLRNRAKSRDASRSRAASRNYRKVHTAIPVDEVSSAEERETPGRSGRSSLAPAGDAACDSGDPAGLLGEIENGSCPYYPDDGCGGAERSLPDGASHDVASMDILGSSAFMTAPASVRTLADLGGPLYPPPQMQSQRNVGYAEGDDLTMVALARLPPRSEERARL